MKGQHRRTFTEAPTFRKIVYAKMDLPNAELKFDSDSDTAVGDFEFAFAPADPSDLKGSFADEIVSSGAVLPVYPVFNQNLIASGRQMKGEEELADGMGRLTLSSEKGYQISRSTSPSSILSSDVAHDMEDPYNSDAPYCIWTSRSTPAPESPEKWQKSSSTGSAELEFRRFRIRDLVIGRSRSDGKENLAHFPAAEKETKRSGVRPNPFPKPTAEAEKSKSGTGGVVSELDVVTGHRIYYGKKAAGARRSFLPYREGLLIGFFRSGKRRPF